ncbi:hypothetical protein Pint_27192 [Pistacia integerrima]|uniref:Uncharacterized protein n=1 Tax=Pistacia integerrima TaxID=434235 RepID=A0ACC0YVP9_9ROSI|nr:hypothetical protein Pint_27192 [Pistacia integerrima]
MLHKNAHRIPKDIIHVQANKFQQHHYDCCRRTRVSDFLVLCWDLWIQGYKKRDTFCCLNHNRKCYSSSSGSRDATSRSHGKRFRF